MEDSKEILDKMLELRLLERKLDYNEFMLYTNKQTMVTGIFFKTTIISITLLLTHMTFAYNINTSWWFLILPLYIAYWSVSRNIYNHHDNKLERIKLNGEIKETEERIESLAKEIKLLLQEDANKASKVSLESSIYNKIIEDAKKTYGSPINIPKDEFAKIVSSVDDKPFTLNLTK